MHFIDKNRDNMIQVLAIYGILFPNFLVKGVQHQVTLEPMSQMTELETIMRELKQSKLMVQLKEKEHASSLLRDRTNTISSQVRFHPCFLAQCRQF